MNGVELGYGIAGMAMLFVGIVLAILWICVPFAVFGIKPLLRSILAELKRSNAIAETQPGRAPQSAAAQPDLPQRGALGTIRDAIRQADQG